MSEPAPRKADAFAPPRVLDHIVLPVASLELARARYEALGFTVAPDAAHPFGTENCCVFLGNDTFLEPLAIRRREDAEVAQVEGNTFVRRDAAYRFRRDIEGFSHLVVKTEDASADHASYARAGMSAGEMVRFERAFELPSGETGEVAFALAFAGDLRAPDAGFFACEVVKRASADRAALMDHPNGAVALSEVVLSEPNPTDFQYFLQDFLDQRRMEDHSFGIEFALANARVSVLTATGLKAFCGLDASGEGRGLLHQTFVIAVRSLAAVRTRLDEGAIEYQEVGARLLVPWAPGQGTAILFEEAG